MGTEAEGLQIPIGFSLAEAQAALRTLEAEARTAGKRIQTGVEAGTQGMETAGKSLSAFAREQRREAGTARYFVSEFASFLPVGSQSREVLMSLTSALVGGFGFGMALEGVSLGVRLLTSHFREQEEAEAKAKKAAEDHAKAMRDLRFETDQYIAGLQGATSTQIWLAQKERELSEKTLADRQRMAEITAKLAGNEAAYTEARRAQADRSHVALYEQGNEAIVERNRLIAEQAVLQARLDVASRDAAVNRAEFERRIQAEEIAGAKKASKDRSEARERETEERLRAQTEEARRILAEQQKAYAAQEALAVQEFERLQTLQAQTRIKARAFGEAGGALDKAGQLEALYTESAQKLEQIRSMEKEGGLLHAEAEAMRTAVTQDEANKRLAILRGEYDAIGKVRQMGVDALRSFATAATAEFGKSLTSSRAYTRAMEAATGATVEGADLSAAAFAKIAQEALASLAQRSIVEALFYTAVGFGHLATGNPKAAEAFIAAATFAATAAAAGTAAYAIGQTRGTTRAERTEIDAARETEEERRLSAESSSGAREVGGASFAAGTPVIHERVIIYVGDPFMTPAENAAAIARRMDLVERLDLRARSG